MRPFVSVIVPCRNEASFIERCLDSILGSDYPAGRLEVIVADGMSGDGTRSLLEVLATRDPRLRMIDNPERITPVALNRAIAAAQGEILVRFDGHAVMPPDYVRRCVELLESAGADNAGGSIRTVAQSDGPFSGPIVAALSSRFGVGNSSFRTSGRAPGRHRFWGLLAARDLFAHRRIQRETSPEPGHRVQSSSAARRRNHRARPANCLRLLCAGGHALLLAA
jgi:cellulose synthase/poly-beta-1,6-N-acetylglucosamine synthase-like glycosyltransferase